MADVDVVSDRLNELAVKSALAHLGRYGVGALWRAGTGFSLSDVERQVLRDGWNGSLIEPDDRLTRLGEMAYSTCTKELVVPERQSLNLTANEREALIQQQRLQQQQQLQARNIAEREEARDKAEDVTRKVEQLKNVKVGIETSTAPEPVKQQAIEQVREQARDIVREASREVRTRILKHDFDLGR